MAQSSHLCCHRHRREYDVSALPAIQPELWHRRSAPLTHTVHNLGDAMASQLLAPDLHSRQMDRALIYNTTDTALEVPNGPTLTRIRSGRAARRYDVPDSRTEGYAVGSKLGERGRP